MSTVVELSRTPLMCVTAIGGAAGVQDAIDAVENKLDKNLKGRKCYGVITYDHNDMHYRACVVMESREDAEKLGFETGEIPAGRYARERVKNFDYRTDVPKIIKTFEKLVGENEVDNTRPSLEFYRRHDEILIHVPIK